MNELFNLSDDNFVRSSDRMHAFKLGRPAPKVNKFLFDLHCCANTIVSLLMTCR